MGADVFFLNLLPYDKKSVIQFIYLLKIIKIDGDMHRHYVHVVMPALLIFTVVFTAFIPRMVCFQEMVISYQLIKDLGKSLSRRPLLIHLYRFTIEEMVFIQVINLRVCC